MSKPSLTLIKDFPVQRDLLLSINTTLLENASIPGNTVSKNVYQAILFLCFIEVVIYGFSIGSLEVFSLKIRHVQTFLMLMGQFSR